MIFQKNGVTITPLILRSMEDALLKETDGSAILWCGRAATALFWAYRASLNVTTETPQPEVILPSISCAAVANAALLARLKPRFADVDAHTGLTLLKHIKARYTRHTRAVVFIHLFGQTADLKPLAEWCRARNIILIEDNAQALGAKLPDGKSVGSVADMSIYSFNRTKLLECGGGALMLRSKEFVQALEQELRTCPITSEPDDETSSLLELSSRNLHHALVALARLRLQPAPKISDLFLRIRAPFEKLYLRSMKNPDVLAKAWQELPTLLEKRYRKADIYESRLAGGPWKLLNGWKESRVCWRYSLLVHFPDQLVSFSEAVRRDGFHVSNLYWPAGQFFFPEDVCPNAEAFARRIVNLWVDNSLDSKYVNECAESLLNNCKYSHITEAISDP